MYDDDDDDYVCADFKSQVQVWVVHYEESLQYSLVFHVKKPTVEIYGRVLDGIEKDATVNTLSQRGQRLQPT